MPGREPLVTRRPIWIEISWHLALLRSRSSWTGIGGLRRPMSAPGGREGGQSSPSLRGSSLLSLGRFVGRRGTPSGGGKNRCRRLACSPPFRVGGNPERDHLGQGAPAPGPSSGD